jgi:hypothetical protein
MSALPRALYALLACLLVAALLPAAALPRASAKPRANTVTKKAKTTACPQGRHGARCRARRTVVRPIRRPTSQLAPGPGVARPPTTPAPGATPLPVPPPPAASPTSAPSSTTPGPRPFAPDSFLNHLLPPQAPLDANSAGYVADLQRQLGSWLPWINTTEYSSPVYTVPADQPTVSVTLDKPACWDLDLRQAWQRVPMPPTARPAAGTDRTMIVWQPSTDTMWEFWLAAKQADGWHATWGGRMQHVSQNPGYYADPPNWGATATSLPMLGGLIRIDELRAGHIDHALALAIPQARAHLYSWPAQRTDGTSTSSNAIPEGTRFRLDPALDLASLHLPRTTRIIAEAAQRYGIVVRDTAGSVTFYAEDPTPTAVDPYTGAGGFFGGQYPSELLAGFPWARLQALQTELHSS